MPTTNRVNEASAAGGLDVNKLRGMVLACHRPRAIPRGRLALLASAVLASVAADSMGRIDTFSTMFPGSALPTEMSKEENPGYHVNVTGGQCVISKDMGSYFEGGTTFFDCEAEGDFTVTVDVDMSGGATGSVVLYAGFGKDSMGREVWGDVYYTGANQICANFFVGSTPATDCDSPITPPTSPNLTTFKIIRSGTTATFQYKIGSTFVTLSPGTTTVPAGAARIALVVIEEAMSTAAYSAGFDNFSVSADDLHAIVTTQPVDDTTLPDGVASFTVAGQGTVTYQWQVEDSTAMGGWRNLTDGALVIDMKSYGDISGSQTATLTRDGSTGGWTDPDKTRLFRCVVTNSCGSTISNSAVLIIGPCKADLNGDDIVDFADYLEFLTAYDAGC